MPSNTTHRLFANDVIKELPASISKTFSSNIKLYQVFAQSFDNLFYYNLLTINKGKEIRDFAHKAQKQKTAAYLINIVRIMKEHHLEYNPEALAYLYGSIAHYVLDSKFHPYVFFKTGLYNRKKPKTYKYNGLHTKMETMLDKYFYEFKYNNDYSKYKAYIDNFPKVSPSNSTLDLVTEVFLKTFKKEDIGKIYFKSFNQGRFIFKYGVYDPYGWKKCIYSVVDFIRPKKYKKCRYVSANIKKVEPNYLNLSIKIWYNSAIEKECNYSVNDLYDQAIKKCISIIISVHKILNNELLFDRIYNIIPNISYVSGLDLDRHYKMQIFEF